MAGRLSFRERCRIEVMAQEGASVREIGECLGRAESTVRREISRGGGWLGYSADRAQGASREPFPLQGLGTPSGDVR